MKAIIRTLLVSVALVGAGQAMAAGKAKAEPNCEIKGKKKHVKDQATCEKDKGKWMGAAAAPAAPAADTTTTAPAAPAAGTEEHPATK